MARPRRELTPNHQDKRRQIVEATHRVLLREGRGGCTTRAIAAESALASSLIHYYFTSVDEIVDAVMGDLFTGIRDRLKAVSADPDRNARERVWSVVDEHVDAFLGDPDHATLWIDYWLSTNRAGRLDAAAYVYDAFFALYTELLVDAGVDEPAARARALCSYVIGAATRLGMHPQDQHDIRSELAILVGLPRKVS